MTGRLGDFRCCAHSERTNSSFGYAVAVAQHAFDVLLPREQRIFILETDEQQCHIVRPLHRRRLQPLAQRRDGHDNLVVIVVTQIAALALKQTDHLKWDAIDAHGFAHRICIREQLVGDRLSDHNNTCSRTDIAIGQKTAFGRGDVGHNAIFRCGASRLCGGAAARRDQLDAAADLGCDSAHARYLTQNGAAIALG